MISHFHLEINLTLVFHQTAKMWCQILMLLNPRIPADVLTWLILIEPGASKIFSLPPGDCKVNAN